MGYNGKGPIGKRQEGIIEPLQLPSQFAKDKTRLGYGQHVSPRQNQNNYQKPQWRAKKKYNENSWQESLHQVAETTRKEKEHQEEKK